MKLSQCPVFHPAYPPSLAESMGAEAGCKVFLSAISSEVRVLAENVGEVQDTQQYAQELPLPRFETTVENDDTDTRTRCEFFKNEV